MAIRFFFAYDNKIVMLPVNPAQLQIKSDGSNKQAEVVGLGEVSILKDRKLQSISIETILPASAGAPYINNETELQLPQFYIDFFEGIRSAKKPCRLVITDTDINMLVSIDGMTYGLQAGDDDTIIGLDLKEYRTYKAREVTITTPTNPAEDPVIDDPTDQREPAGFAIGDKVIVAGKYYSTSYGTGSSGTFPANFTGKISHIVADTTRKNRYHIQTLTGGARGWVEASQLKHST